MSLIVKVICMFLKQIIQLVFLPLDLIVTTWFSQTDLATILDKVYNYISYFIPFTKWVLSWLPFSEEFYAFVVLVLIFIYSVPLLTNTIKTIVKWWHYLAP